MVQGTLRSVKHRRQQINDDDSFAVFLLDDNPYPLAYSPSIPAAAEAATGEGAEEGEAAAPAVAAKPERDGFANKKRREEHAGGTNEPKIAKPKKIEEKKKAAEIDAHDDDDVNDVNDVNEPTISTPSEGEKKKAPSKKRYIIFVGSFKRWMDACDIY